MLTSTNGFELPPDDAWVWRYLDVGRFLTLVHEKALYFSRPSEMLDSWEGVPPMKIARGIHPANLEWWVGHTQHLVFNCWHENKDESVAMWRLYTTGAEGVAIQSTVARLKRLFIQAGPVIRIARVRYIDDVYEGQPAPANPGTPDYRPEPPQEFEFLLYKRHVYAHEQEVRAMTFAERNEAGVSVPVDLRVLIQRIVVSPTYPPWALNSLQNLIERNGLCIPIERSKCGMEPPAFCKGRRE